jgi:hypothetical protein
LLFLSTHFKCFLSFSFLLYLSYCHRRWSICVSSCSLIFSRFLGFWHVGHSIAATFVGFSRHPVQPFGSLCTVQIYIFQPRIVGIKLPGTADSYCFFSTSNQALQDESPGFFMNTTKLLITNNNG